MDAATIRKDAKEFVHRLHGQCSVDQLIEQSKVVAQYETAAQLAELNAQLVMLTKVMTDIVGGVWRTRK